MAAPKSIDIGARPEYFELGLGETTAVRTAARHSTLERHVLKARTLQRCLNFRERSKNALVKRGGGMRRLRFGRGSDDVERCSGQSKRGAFGRGTFDVFRHVSERSFMWRKQSAEHNLKREAGGIDTGDGRGHQRQGAFHFAVLSRVRVACVARRKFNFGFAAAKHAAASTGDFRHQSGGQNGTGQRCQQRQAARHPTNPIEPIAYHADTNSFLN